MTQFFIYLNTYKDSNWGHETYLASVWHQDSPNWPGRQYRRLGYFSEVWYTVAVPWWRSDFQQLQGWEYAVTLGEIW